MTLRDLTTVTTLLVLAALCRTAPAHAAIDNIERFLDKCPNGDPVYAALRADFEIRRDGVVVGAIPCSGPVSALPLSQYTDELIAVQGLRTLYYMDLGRSGHLPWTPGTLYAWLKSRIGGINIGTNIGLSYCCDDFGGKKFIAVKAQDDFNRDFDRAWRGIAGNLELYLHEARHIDKPSHVSCCGIANGCDAAYVETDLSPYGIQWWLNYAWLTGNLNVGFACLAAPKPQEIAQWHLTSSNSGRTRFCGAMPPSLTTPPTPGGPCPPVALPPPTNLRVQ